MKKVLQRSAFMIAALYAASVHAEAPSAEAFGNLPLAEYGSLAPDGKHLAIVQPVRGRDGVMIYDLTKTDAKPYALAMDGAVAKGLFWKSNDRLIVTFVAHMKQQRSHDVFAWSRAVSVDATGDNAVTLMHGSSFLRKNIGGANIVDRAPGDPSHVYIAAWETNAEMSGNAPLAFDQFYLNLFKVNVLDGSNELVLHGTAQTAQYITDGTGHVVGRLEEDDNLQEHLFFGTRAEMNFDGHAGGGADIGGLMQNGDLALASPGPSGMRTLIALGTGTTETLFSDAQYDVAEPLFDERTGRVIGVSYYDDMLRSRYFDPALQRLQASLEKAFPGQSVQILSKDDSGSSYVILTDGPQTPPVLSLFTRANHQVNILQEAYPGLKRELLGQVKPYPYKAKDGLDIHAYLTLPPGTQAHNLPTVIFPHGGPESRDGMNFDWWAQFLATRGYAVLQANYRGSAGYGSAFVKAGDAEWVGKVQQDLRDGVDKLVSDGIADPKRICIVGASWGGYLALAGVTFQPDLYACAISFGGSSDLAGDVIGADQSEVQSIWKRRIGENPKEQSPVDFAERVQAPVLLIHSDKDAVVPIEQSKMEERALRRADKQVEFIVLEGEDHYLEFADTRVRLLKEIERFLDAHIGERRAASTAKTAAQKDVARPGG